MSVTLYSNAAARATADAVLSRLPHDAPHGGPEVGIILGSGLGALADVVQGAARLSYSEVPGLVPARVEGHAGVLAIGTLDGVGVAVFAGRYHFYEGHPPPLVGFPVRVAYALGARTLLVANAAGGINPRFAPGDLMLIADHINLSGHSPLVGPVDDGDVRFPDTSDAYDHRLRALLHGAARRCAIPVREGVYAATLGPAYETPAEIRMLRTLGADAVGMSTVPEVLTARALSMRVAGISCIANMASGMTPAPLAHAAVVQSATQTGKRFQALVRAWLASLAATARER